MSREDYDKVVMQLKAAEGVRVRQGVQGQGKGWQQQGRRKGGMARGQRREQPFQLALRNRFQGN